MKKIRKTFTTKGCPNDKYYSFDGKIETKCPFCKEKLIYDFSNDHIEYISLYVGNDYFINFYCEKCDKEFDMPVFIKEISYSIDLEYNTGDFKVL